MIICVKASSTSKSINWKWRWGEPSTRGSPRGRFCAQVSDWLPALDGKERESSNSKEACQPPPVSASSERCFDLIYEKKGWWLDEWKQTNTKATEHQQTTMRARAPRSPSQALAEAANFGRAGAHAGGHAAEPGGPPTVRVPYRTHFCKKIGILKSEQVISD